MKENSIEEDIEILEELRLRGYAMLLMKYEDRIKTNRKIDQALEHILSDYKRVLQENEYMHNELDKQQTKINKYAKENEELKKSKITYEKVRDIQEKNKNIVDKNYIHKQKIKDKIEEINKMIAREQNDAVIIQLGKQKRILQKLLESEE